MNYVADFTVRCCTLAMLGLAMDVFIGHLGVFWLPIAALAGTGAYAAVMGCLMVGIPVFPAILIAGVVGAVIALAARYCVARAEGDYVALSTLAMCLVVSWLFAHGGDLTGGHGGLTGFPTLSLPLIGSGPWTDALVAAVATAVVCALIVWFTRTEAGLLAHALRDDQVPAAGFGAPRTALLNSAALFSGAIAGSAGAVSAFHSRFVAPSLADAQVSLVALCVVILGGRGRPLGILVAAVLYEGAQELMSELSVPPAFIGPIRGMAFGAVIVAIALFAPGGVARLWSRKGGVTAPPGEVDGVSDG